MTSVNQAFLFLGCAALLIAAVLLRLPTKFRAILMAAIIVSAMVGAQGSQVERVADEIVAYAWPAPTEIASLRSQ